MEIYKTIEEYIINVGYDLSNCDLTGVNIESSNLTDIKLPEDVNLFQKIKKKSLYKVKLPEKDYSNYNFDGVNINGTVFTNSSILPLDRNFFIKISKKEVFETVLPHLDLNNYDFYNVSLVKTIFTKDTILSKDKTFFQNIYNKSIYRTSLPVGDYSCYDFNDVCIIGTDFQEQSKLTEDMNFFQRIRHKSIINTILPDSIVKNISIFNLNGVEVDFNDYKISIMKLYNLYEKYSNEPFIMFPDFNIQIRTNKEIKIKQ